MATYIAVTDFVCKSDVVKSLLFYYTNNHFDLHMEDIYKFLYKTRTCTLLRTVLAVICSQFSENFNT